MASLAWTEHLQSKTISEFSKQNLVDQLQQKMTMYKKQVEEAEEIAALNLAKFRQVQANMSDAQERAELSELALAKFRAYGRSNQMVIN